MATLNMGVSYNTLNKSKLSPSKKLILSFVSIVLIGIAATFAYATYYSDQAQVRRLVSTYYMAQSVGDLEKMKAMETAQLQSSSGSVLGESTTRGGKEKTDKSKLSIVGIKLHSESGAVTGQINTQDTDVLASPPVLVQVLKIEGKWKINVFNIGLLTREEAQ